MPVLFRETAPVSWPREMAGAGVVRMCVWYTKENIIEYVTAKEFMSV